MQKCYIDGYIFDMFLSPLILLLAILHTISRRKSYHIFAIQHGPAITMNRLYTNTF